MINLIKVDFVDNSDNTCTVRFLRPANSSDADNNSQTEVGDEEEPSYFTYGALEHNDADDVWQLWSGNSYTDKTSWIGNIPDRSIDLNADLALSKKQVQTMFADQDLEEIDQLLPSNRMS